MSGATLKDVADRAGVSVATVSRVLHSNGYVSAAARGRVEAALRDSGYRLNAVAQGLRRQRTITLGLILHGILPNPFFAEVAMGVEHSAVEHGFNVLIFNAQGETARERLGVESLLTRRVDGIIFTTALSADNVQLALGAGVGVVEIERQLVERSAAVIVDNFAGASEAMQHLIKLGHRRIGYIGDARPFLQGADSQPVDRVLKERFDAYRSALVATGSELDNACIVQLDRPRYLGGLGGLSAGAEYMSRLLEKAPDVTAVFAASDLLAAGALQSLYAHSIPIPAKMSVVGFDDTLARHLAPALTTVRQPMFDMGVTAVELAIRMIDEPQAAPSASWCSTNLIIRESTAALR